MTIDRFTVTEPALTGGRGTPAQPFVDRLNQLVDGIENGSGATGYVAYADYAPASDLSSATSALVAAATAAKAENKSLVLGKRRIYLPTVANLTSAAGLHVIGEGPEDTVFYHDSTAYMMSVTGGTYDSTHSLLTVNAAAGATTLTVASTARLAVGQYANLQSTEIWEATSGKNARYGELVRIKSIDSGTVVTLYQPIDYAYTTANAGKLNYCPLGRSIVFKGLGFENTAPLTAVGGVAGAMSIAYADGIVLEDITGVSLDGPLITLNGCADASLSRINGREMADDEANDRYGYVINLGAAVRGTVVTQGHAINCRHYVTTNAGSTSTVGGVAAHNTIIGCTATGFQNVCFDTHEEGDDTTFIGCKAVATHDIGFHARAPRTRFLDCAVDGALGTAFYVRATATQSVLRNVQATNLLGALSARSNATNGARILAAETTLEGFDFSNLGDSGVVLSGNRQAIRNGRIYNMGVSGNPQGVRFNASSIDHVMENILVDGVSGGTGYYATGVTVTGLQADNLRSRRCSNHSLNLPLETEEVIGTISQWVSKSPQARTTSTVTVGAEWKPQDQGLIAWPFDMASAVNTSIITAGTLYLTAVWVPACTISNISFFVATPAASLTTAFVAIYHGTSKALLASSASAATITEFQKTNTAIDVAMATPLAVATPQLVRVGFYTNGGTPPTFGRSTNSAITNHGLASTVARQATANTGLTTALPDPHGAMALSGVGFWVGVK